MPTLNERPVVAPGQESGVISRKINVIVRGAIPPDLAERLAKIQAAAIRSKTKPMQAALAAGRDRGEVMSNDHSQETTREQARKTPTA